MKPALAFLRFLCPALAALSLATGALAELQAELPPVVARYEQILVKSPEKGTAFDKVYAHFFENDGLEKLAARWRECAKPGNADTARYDLLLGLLAERQGKTADARAAFTKATELTPADPRAWRALGDLEAAEGKLPAAIAAFQKALAANPPAAERALLYRQLARSQQRNLDAASALATWQKMAAEFPTDPFVLEEVAEAQLEAEKFDEAKATFTRLRDLADTDPFKKVTATIRLAQVEERQGKTKEALAIYENALPQASETSWIHRDVRGRIEEVYRRQDDLPGLVAYYEKWIAAHDKDVEAATRLSLALVELNRKKDAVAWMQKAVAWAPDRRELQIDLAKMLRETEQADEAQKILAALTAAHPEELSYWEMLGDTEWQIFKKSNAPERKKSALDAWQKLAPPDSKDANRINRLADILRENGLNDEALVQFERAAASAPEASDLRERWAGFLFELKRDADAWKILDGLVEGSRANAANYQRLAAAQTKYGKLDAALESVKKGIALAPADFSLLALQWRILNERKDWAAAAALYEPMLAAAPAMYDQIEQQYLQSLKAADKFEAAQKELSAKLATAKETEVRLLARMCLQADDLPGARQALDEGAKRFADSFSLAQLEADYQKRSGNADGRVAALRRLMKLEPKQATDFLQEIARAYQEQNQWDKALAAAQEWIIISPANADAQVFYADLSFGAGKSEEGIAKLREAIKLSEKPNQIRQRLCMAYSQIGDLPKAQQTAEEAFEAETDPSVKLGLLRTLSEFYFQQGKIDTLITRFRERQRAEEGGWRYALYLSEIFQQMQDYGQAREELAKSLASRPKDPALLKQLLRLAEQEGNSAEQARYYKAIAEVEPSAANQSAYAEALADSGDSAAAIQVLLAHEADLLKDPAPWRMAMAKVQKEGAAASLNTALENALRQRPDDFVGRMTLAEIQIALGNSELAKRALGEVRRMPKPAQTSPVPPPAAKSPMMGMRFNPFGGQVSPITQRIYAAQMAQQSFEELLQSQQASSGYGGRYGHGFYRRSYFGRGYYGGMPGMQPVAPPAPTFEETRDKALVYLAAIAVRENKAEAFLAELEKELAAQNADRKERFLCFSLVQARDLIWKEIQAQADAPAGGNELDELCLEYLPQYFMNGPNGPSPESAKAAALLEKFGTRIAKADPKRAFMLSMMNYGIQKQFGNKEEAKKLLPGLLEKLDETQPDQLQFALSAAIEEGELERAEQYLSKTLALQKKNKTPGLGNSYWIKSSLAQAYLKKKDTKNAARIYAESFQESLPVKPGGTNPAFGGMFFGGGFGGGRFRGTGNYLPPVPYPNRYIDDQRLNLLRQTFQALKPQNALEPFLDALDKMDVPKEIKIYPQLALVDLKWLDDKKEASLKDAQALLADNPDDEVRLLVAGMLSELKKNPDAIALLDQITTRQGDVYKRAQQMMLKFAKTEKDTDNARKAVLRLVSLRPPRDEINQLLPDLKELGLTEKAEQIEKQITRTTVTNPNDMNRMVNLLQGYMNEKKETEALGLAQTILGQDPLANPQNNDWARRTALDALERFKKLDGYIADLEKQAAMTPDSVRVCMLVAEAWAVKDVKKAPEWFKKVIALKPGDSRLKWRLIESMRNRDQNDEAFKMCQEMLEKEPQLLFENNFDFIGSYTQAKKLPELAQIVLKQDATPSTSGLSINSGNDQRPYFCNRLGQDLRNLYKGSDAAVKDPATLELAAKVWLKGIELTNEENAYQMFDIRNNLINALAELGRKEEALQQADAFYFPPAPKKQAVLGMNRGYSSYSWMNSTTSNGSGMVDYPGLAPLRIIERLGGLADLLKKVEAKSDKDESMKALALMIRLRQRDPKLLSDIPKLLAETPAANPFMPGMLNNGTFLRVISRDLAAWPQARRLSLDVLIAAKKRADLNPQNTYETLGVRQQLFTQALDLGETEIARATAKEYVDSVLTNITMGNFNNEQTFGFIRSLLDLDMTAEAEKLLTTIKTSQQARNNTYMLRQLAPIEAELALAKGVFTAPQAIVCPAGEENGKTVLLWEIHSAAAVAANTNKRSAQFEFACRDNPKLDGRWDIELLALTSNNTAQRLALIPKAKSRGKWTGKLPEGIVTVQAVLRTPASAKKDAVAGPSYTGVWTTALSAPNLLVNPGFEAKNAPQTTGTAQTALPTIQGWDSVPEVALLPGGPRPGGTQILLKSFDAQYQQQKITGEKIPVQKGKDYLQTGWLKKDQNGYVNLGMRFLDENGKQIGNTQCPYYGNNSGNWCFLTQSLSTTTSGSGRQRIPDKAAFLQAYIEFSNTVTLDGLYVGETSTPVATPKPASSPTPTPTPSPTPAATSGTTAQPFAQVVPAGMENGKSVILWVISPFDPKFSRSSNSYTVLAKADPNFDDRYDIELLYLTPPNTVQRLALIPKAKASGKWTGKLPEGAGSIQAHLSPAGGKSTHSGTYFGGNETPIVNAPNLVVNPGFAGVQASPTPQTTGTSEAAPAAMPPVVKGWQLSPEADALTIAVQPGGPRPGGTQVFFSFPGKKTATLLGEKTPVQKDKNYTLTAWSSFQGRTGYQGQQASRMGLQYLDKDGKVIGTDFAIGSFRKGEWSLCSRAITTSKNASGNRRGISEFAVSIRPILEIRGDFALDGLFLGETVANPNTNAGYSEE